MRRPLSPAEMYPAKDQSVSTRFVQLSTGVKLRLAESGPERGMPLLCLHGWGASLFMFRHALELLAPRGFRVTALDLRGSGLSDKPKAAGAYAVDAFRADLTALIDKLGYDRVALMGQSMGGGVALDFALTHPERVGALAMINPTGLSRAPYVRLLCASPRFVARTFGRRLVPRWVVAQILCRLAYGDPRLVTESTIDEYWAPTRIPGHVAAARAELSEMQWAPLPADRLRTLATPCLLMLGRRDRLIRIPDAVARAPWVSQVHMLDGGHCAHEEAPEEAMGVLERFVRAARV